MAPSSTLIEFSGAAFLAPMAGVSDPAMRLLCRRRGAGLVATELTSIHGIVAGADGAARAGIPDFSEEERPVSVQLFGSDEAVLKRAAKTVEPFFDMIDYNMGCPAPHITRQMAGGALLREEKLTRRILRALVGSVEKPVTLKMRAGVAPENGRLFLEIAEAAQDEGVAMIALHPRTVSQGYSGVADWSLIRDLKKAVRIPVVGNGDVASPQDAKRMIEQTGCDYVMVGRGAMGNPFIFEQINDLLRSGGYERYGARERVGAFFEYFELARGFGLRFANVKGQAMRFARGFEGAAELRHAITAVRSAEELEGLMRKAAARLEVPARRRIRGGAGPGARSAS